MRGVGCGHGSGRRNRWKREESLREDGAGGLCLVRPLSPPSGVSLTLQPKQNTRQPRPAGVCESVVSFLALGAEQSGLVPLFEQIDGLPQDDLNVVVTFNPRLLGCPPHQSGI